MNLYRPPIHRWVRIRPHGWEVRSRYSTLQMVENMGSSSPQALNHGDSPKSKPFQINLRTSPFTKKNKQGPTNYLQVPLDTFPNPLFSMSKSEILQLSKEEYAHLISVPFKAPEEQAFLCANIILIIDESIVIDPKLAVRFLSGNPNSTLHKGIVSTLVQKFADNSVKMSMLHYILEPTSREFRSLFLENLASICLLKDVSTRGVILLNYLSLLAGTKIPNPKSILLSDRLYKLVVRNTPPERFHELYSCMVQLNVQTEQVMTLQKLKKTLSNGSPLEKFVVRTGWHMPKWHETLAYTFTEDQKHKMLQFLTIEDLKVFSENFIKEKDIVNSNVYLNLLIEKLELKTLQITNRQHFLKGDSQLSDDIHSIIQVALQFFMTFKGPSSCLKILKYMKRNQLDINFDILLIIIKQLDRQRHFQEVLSVINNVSLTNLSHTDRFNLVEEILILIKKRFPKTPEVMVGYVAAMLNGTDNKSLELLNDLKLLGITHGNGQIGSISSFESIQKANIDEKLTGFEFSSNSLANYYEMVLHSLRREVDAEFIYKLFQNYMTVVSQNSGKYNTFEKMNDRVVYHLINFLLRKRPGSSDFKLHEGLDRYNTAKKIFNEFTSKVTLPRRSISTSSIDLLVYSSLILHKDFVFAAEVLKYSRAHNVPFTFNQIYPFIKYHHSRKEYDRAHLWYKELVKHAIVATAQPAKEIFKIARELNWEVNGFKYRTAIIKKNSKARSDLESVRLDPLVFFQELPKKDLDDIDEEDGAMMTDELITGKEYGNIQADFVSELTSML